VSGRDAGGEDEGRQFPPRASALILAPVDFCSPCEVSGQYAVEVARALEAELIFLHVISENPLAGSVFFPSGRSEPNPVPDEGEREEALGKLEAFVGSLALSGVRYQVRVEKGVPYRIILEAADRLRPRFLIQGTHGSSGLEGMVLGGTAEKVIRKVVCPVISVKPRGFGSFLDKIVEGIGLFDGDQGDRRRKRDAYPFPPGRILYPTDFSEASRLAVEPAVNLARMAGAELIVLHIAPQDPDAEDPGPAGDSDQGEGRPSIRSRMDALLRQMRAYDGGLRLRPLFLKSGSTSAILSVAVEEEVDLLVMGTHGRTGWKTILTGSTAGRLIRNAPCPVATLRPNWKMEEVEKKFGKVFRRLSSVDLQQLSSENQPLFSEELLACPEGMKETDLFLNYYSRDGLLKAFEEYGILNLLRRRGLGGFRLAFDLSEPFRHRLRFYCDGREDPEHLLIDLIMREGFLQPQAGTDRPEDRKDKGHAVLVIEWLCMQNPCAVFSPQRPPLPGQDYPGLGIGYQAQEFLILMGKRLRKDGILNQPQYFHNARLYHEKFRFFDPVEEGRLISLIRDVGDFNLTDVSWAVVHGCLLDGSTGEPVPWRSGPLVYALDEGLKGHFRSEAYQETVWDTVANTRYRIDWEGCRERLKSDGRPGGEPRAPGRCGDA